MAIYFHCALLPLAPGSIICPGNWGRIIRLYRANDQGTYQIAFRERVLEDVRQTHFPDKPSRLASCFVLFTFTDAQFFRDNLQRLSIIYEVEPVLDPHITPHEGDYSLVGAVGAACYFDEQKKLAMSYWGTPPQQRRELLLPVPIRILRCVDDLVSDLPGLRDGINASHPTVSST